MYLLSYSSKCSRSRCRLNHIDEIYLNVKKIAKTPHLFKSYRTSKFSILFVLIFLCTFHLIRLSRKSKSCFIFFKQVTHSRPDTSCLASNNKAPKVHYARCETMLCIKLYCTRVVLFAYFRKKLRKSS